MASDFALGRFMLYGKASASPDMAGVRAKASRDARIDVVRGLALLVIFINHMPGNVLSQWMPHNFGFSDAADAFVLLAGLSATLAYGAVIDRHGLLQGARKVGARIRTLYVAHIAVFLLVCGIVATAVTRTENPLYIETINIQPVCSEPLRAFGDALMLMLQPNFLDILPLYIVLLAVFPLIYIAAKASPLATLTASLTIWQVAVANQINLPNAGNSGWYFNPFAWQLVFTIGVVLGRARQLGLALPRSLAVDVAAVAFIALAYVIKVSSGNPFGIAALNDWIDTVQLGSDKTNLAWVRVLHVGSLAWLAIRLLPAGAVLAKRAAGAKLAEMGRHSLEVFCAGTILAIVGQIVMAETSFDLGVQLLVCALGAMLLIGLGTFLTWYKSLAVKRSAEAQSARSVASASQY